MNLFVPMRGAYEVCRSDNEASKGTEHGLCSGLSVLYFRHTVRALIASRIDLPLLETCPTIPDTTPFPRGIRKLVLGALILKGLAYMTWSLNDRISRMG